MTEAELIGEIVDMLGSAQQLATELTIARRLVLRWQNGSREVHPNEWRDIADVLERRLSTTRVKFADTAAGRRARWARARMIELLEFARHYSTKEARAAVKLPEHLEDWNRE